ncbi:organic anion transporter 7-like [Ochotona princeps]|uniref:organic anion transporter 7-like n=1 Tax=Ochotona princeps TaxID=9978 RepID=UPI002714CB29|nr:organic anion transporter 7-like [Ochotona princeps]
MAFNDLLKQAGGMGRFQILQFLFLIGIFMITFIHVQMENFTAAIPGHRCRVPLLDNHTVSNDTGILSQDALLRVSIPLDSNLKPDKCRRFTQPQWQLLQHNGTFLNTHEPEPDTEPCVDGWVYDRSTFVSTIVMKWDLVCEAESMSSMVKFLLMAGMMLGNIIFGRLTDRFGRKLVLTWCLLQMAIADTCAAFAPSFLIYCLLRFLTGMSATTIMGNITMLIIEWTLPQFQALGVAYMSSASNLGQAVLGGIAYVVRDWQILQLIFSVPFFVFFVCSRWIAESSRWLMVANKPEKALKQLKKAAHRNGIKNVGDTLTMEVVKSTMKEELAAAQTKFSFWDLFRTSIMRKRIFCLAFARFANSMLFYGLSLNIHHLGNNIFLIQCLFGFINILANCVALLVMNHIGRRISQVVLLFVTGICVVSVTFVPDEMQTPCVALATLGIAAGTSAATFLPIYSNELIPTVCRSTFGGINSLFSGVGAVLVPLMMTLVVYSPHLPWIMYGVFPILSGLIVFCLQETRNQPFPETIQDVENSQSHHGLSKDDLLLGLLFVHAVQEEHDNY